jgi:hypothetical protein
MDIDSISHGHAVQNQMAERYVLRELPEDQREAFEAHYFDCNECFRDVKLAAEFLHHTHVVLPPGREKSGLARLTADLWPPLPAFAAVLLFCALGFNVYQRQKIESLKAPRAESRYFLSGEARSRGDGAASGDLARERGPEPKLISIPRDLPVSLEVEVQRDPTFRSYEARILDSSEKLRFSIPLTLGQDDISASIVIPPGSLSEGRYSLVVMAQKIEDGEKEVGRGSFYLQHSK